MNIFQAAVADIPRMMQCAKDCCEEHGEARLGGKLDEEFYAAEWSKLIASGGGVMFLAEDGSGRIFGGIGGAIGRVMLTGKMRAGLLFWYVEKSHRTGLTAIRLVKVFEDWAKERGCAQISMAVNEGMSDHSGKFYERRGYEFAETFYRKFL